MGVVTTAVFSVCGMGIFVFVLAAALSLPKQFITVYLGGEYVRCVDDGR
jgi:hypothetical protein